MKTLILVLIILAFIGNSAISEERKTTITNEQQEFAEKIRNKPGFSKAEWVNAYEFDITIDQQYFGKLSKDEAQQFAIALSLQGYGYTKSDICVKIIDPEDGELAYECIAYQNET